MLCLQQATFEMHGPKVNGAYLQTRPTALEWLQHHLASILSEIKLRMLYTVDTVLVMFWGCLQPLKVHLT